MTVNVLSQRKYLYKMRIEQHEFICVDLNSRLFLDKHSHLHWPGKPIPVDLKNPHSEKVVFVNFPFDLLDTRHNQNTVAYFVSLFFWKAYDSKGLIRESQRSDKAGEIVQRIDRSLAGRPASLPRYCYCKPTVGTSILAWYWPWAQ